MSGETIISTGGFSRITPGYRLNEIYEIDSLLATGGMGEVYRGHAIETGDQVAIKTIRPEFAQNASALALFKKEASSLRNLYHEAIVRYFVFSIDRGLPYLAMEYVEGKSLSDFLRNGPLKLDQLQILQKRLASGLFAAHELGIVHRDVSPDNIILPGENLARAKIIDFGIARSTQGEGTVIGSGFAGKFSYVSPEQLGLFGGDVGPQSDIYSLGLVLAEAALGKAIDMGQSHVDVIDKRRAIPDLSGVDSKLRPLITAMLQPNPKDRPASMAEVAEWVPGGRRGGGGRTLGAVAATVVVLGGLGGATWFFLPQIQGQVAGLGASSGGGTPPSEAPAALEPARRAAPGGNLLPDANLLPQAPPPAAPAAREEAAAPPPATRSDPVIASLPPTPAPSVPPPDPTPAEFAVAPGQIASVEQVTTFLQTYSGGECFFVSPIQLALRDAKIEAFGAAPSPFIAFDSAFQRRMGFEPEISLRQITREQCPVAEFLARRNALPSARPPRLAIRSDRLRSGQELAGTVDSRGEPNLEVLLVADDGLVHNLGTYLKRQGDRVDFTLKVEGTGGGEKPQLVVAVTSAKPLPNLKGGPVSAERLFRQLLDETRGGTVVNVSIRYFKLG